MRLHKLVLCLGTVVATLCASAQGTFQNLNFEQANPIFISRNYLIWTTNAFPGWTVYANGVPQPYVSYNQIADPAVAGLAAAGVSYPVLVLDGNYSAILGGAVLVGATVSIAQSGVVPAGSESVRFLAFGGFLVFFAGQPLATVFLGEGPSGSQIYGADVSAYAGDYGQLTFQVNASAGYGLNVLDDIAFSTQPIPEPGMFSIIVLGALLLCQCRLGRRARSPTRHRA